MNEHQHQCKVIEWAFENAAKWPDLDLLFAIANAGAGAQKGQAGKMKAEGVKPGVPDLCLPVARGGYFGLFIEMKDEDGSASKVQNQWIKRLKEQGYYVTLAHGWEIAMSILVAYMGMSRTSAAIGGELRVVTPIERCRLAATVMPLRQCMLDEGHEPPCVPDDRPRIPKFMSDPKIPLTRLTASEDGYTANLSEILDLLTDHYPLFIDIVIGNSIARVGSKESQIYRDDQLVSTPYTNRAGFRLTIFHDCDFNGRKI